MSLQDNGGLTQDQGQADRLAVHEWRRYRW